MMVIFKLKAVCKPHNHKYTTNILSVIQLKGASSERVVGPPGANIQDGPVGVTAPCWKSLAFVDDISGSRSGGWGKFLGMWPLLVKVSRNLGV